MQAVNADDALRLAAERGWTRARLLTDDLNAAMPSPDLAGRPRADPVDRSRFMEGLSPWRAELLTLWIMYRSSLVFVLLAIGVLIYRRVVGRPVGWMDAVSVGMVCLPLVLWMASRGGLAGLHRQMQLAYVRGDYGAVLRVVGRFRAKAANLVAPEFAEVVAAEWHAKALARQGKLDQALAVVEALRQIPGVQPVRRAGRPPVLRPRRAAAEAPRHGAAVVGGPRAAGAEV